MDSAQADSTRKPTIGNNRRMAPIISSRRAPVKPGVSMATMPGASARPSRETTAAAHTLPWPLAMVADLGIAGAICSESPRTCTPFTARDSKVSQSTSHQRLLAVM